MLAQHAQQWDAQAAAQLTFRHMSFSTVFNTAIRRRADINSGGKRPIWASTTFGYQTRVAAGPQ